MHNWEKAMFKRKECKCREVCDKLLYKHTALGMQKGTQRSKGNPEMWTEGFRGQRALGHYKIQRRVVAHTKMAIMHSMGINMAV